MSQSDHFCHDEATDELKEAVRDIPKLQKWVKHPRKDSELRDALDQIYIHHHPQRKIIEDEIKDRNETRSYDLSVSAHNLSKWALVISVIAIIVSVVASFW